MGEYQAPEACDFVEIEDRGPAIAVRLSGVIDICQAVPLHRLALSLERAARDVEIDLGAAERLDASAVQILLALSRGLSAEQRRLSVTCECAEVSEYLKLAGLAGSF